MADDEKTRKRKMKALAKLLGPSVEKDPDLLKEIDKEVGKVDRSGKVVK